jgi:poly(3-hydroxybutyrate) depolymerase
MFNKQSLIAVTAILVASVVLAPRAFALNYSNTQGNQATFETLEEARVNGPIAVATIDGNKGRTYKSHPALDGYPQGTTFIYRSANMYGGRAAARMNTDILVFSDKSFAAKDDALAYLKGLGLIPIIDQAKGSIILVTPADSKAGFGAADQKNYYALQTAIFTQKASATVNKVTTSYSDGEYYGGFGYTYLIGIDGGATFLNNYVATNLDYLGRVAGMLLINGKMDNIRQLATFVPVYLVNAPDAVIEKYKQADSTDASTSDHGVESFYDHSLPLRRVTVATDANADAAKYIKDAYYNLFIKAMRIPVTKAGLYTASTPYQGASGDQDPYSLCERDAVIDGKTADGIHVIHKRSEEFSSVKAPNGEYLQTWVEFLPEEVLNGTAKPGSVPLVLGMHGGGDDMEQYVDEIGLLSLAGHERFAIVAPDHQTPGSLMGPRPGAPGAATQPAEGVIPQVAPRLVKYMLKTYPALDPSRVYATGYSLGGGATLQSINGDPSVFAAAVPMSSSPYVGTPKEVAQFKNTHLPVMFTTSSFDLGGAFDQTAQTIATSYQTQLNLFLGYNGMNTVTYDFKTYPLTGFKADRIEKIKLNGEYNNTRWYIDNADGIPMVAVSYTENLNHALYPEFAKIFWNFSKHYSRDQKTGQIKYDPYAR